jgi:F0F1-type ATP synthase delta subunit
MAPNTQPKPQPEAQQKFMLPALVVGPADVNRLLLEMEALEDYMRQLTTSRKASAKLPKTSRTLDDLAELNHADLLDDSARQHLSAFLESLQQHAPVIHISFAAEPSAAFTGKIVAWMRANISAYVLVQIGLQPSIAGGCVVRTTSKVFDLSLGRFLRAKRDLLLDAIRLEHGAGAVAAASTPAARVSSAAPVIRSVPVTTQGARS